LQLTISFIIGKAVFHLCRGFLSIIDEYNQFALIPVSIHSGILNVPYEFKSVSELLEKYHIKVNHGAQNNLPGRNIA